MGHETALFERNDMDATTTTAMPPSRPPRPSEGQIVRDAKGHEATVQEVQEEKGNVLLTLLSGESGREVYVPLSLLESHADGYYLPLVFGELGDGIAGNQNEVQTIPIRQEELEISKKAVDRGTGVRINKTIEEHHEDVTMQLSQDELEIQHIPVRKIIPANELPAPRQEGSTYIIPVFKEVLVVEKKICLEEEVHIKRSSKQVQESHSIPVKSEKVSVERFDEGKSKK
jgi:uncharacterized protein (TIGR02271 family)